MRRKINLLLAFVRQACRESVEGFVPGCGLEDEGMLRIMSVIGSSSENDASGFETRPQVIVGVFLLRSFAVGRHHNLHPCQSFRRRISTKIRAHLLSPT